MRLEIAYLRAPCFVDGTELRFSHGRRVDLDAARARAVQRVFEGGATRADVLADLGPEAAESVDLDDPEGLIGVIEVEVPDGVDFVMVEQGYGGVYVHSVELFRGLGRRWTGMLLSPVDPLFETEPIEGVVSLDGLKRERPELEYFHWMQIMRSLVKLVPAELLLIMHRSQSLLLFDLLDERRTVIYCDGFYDRMFRNVQQFDLDDSPERRARTLRELHYAAGSSPRGYMGISGHPNVSIHQLVAGERSLRAAVENWCWGAAQARDFHAAFPGLGDSVRLMLPFTDPELFRPQDVDRRRRVLFTTTMHNIDRKGLPELVGVMRRLRTVEADVIVRQPQFLPRIPDGVAARMERRSLPKPEMVDLYHRAWLNFRVSRDESSPMSILELMTCEVPQIVSTVVADQIPIIEDGATGFVIDPDDEERATWAVRTLLEDERLRDRMGRECRRRALTLSLDSRVGVFEELIHA